MSTPFAKLPRWADYGLIPVINLFVAFIVAGIVVLLVGENPLKAAVVLVDGGVRLWPEPRLHALLRHHLHLHRPRRRGRLPCRPVQYRWRGAGLYRRHRRGAGLGAGLPDIRRYPALVADLSAGDRRFGACGCCLGLQFPPICKPSVARTSSSRRSCSTISLPARWFTCWSMSSSRPARWRRRPRDFLEGAQLPKLGWLFEVFGLAVRSAPLNISFLLALFMAWVVWVLIWRTKLGYEMRTFGFSSKAARYAGIGEARITIVAMLISGGLSGMMALNPIMGDQHRMQLEFVAGAGFVGIAVALMGRSHSGRHHRRRDPVRRLVSGRRGTRLRDAQCVARHDHHHDGSGDPVRRRAGAHVPPDGADDFRLAQSAQHGRSRTEGGGAPDVRHHNPAS